MRDDWVECELGEVLEIERGGSPRPIKNYITELPNGINWIKIGDKKASGKFISSTAQKITQEGLHKTRLVEPGDFILSNSMSFGKPYIMAIHGAIHDGWLLLRIRSGALLKDFLYHLLGAPVVFSQFNKLAKGSTVRNLNIGLVSVVKISLPPLPEQRAIVSKIEELFSDLDRGIADLKKAQAQLKVYRQAVLKKAFEGELTREWREKQSGLSGSHLLVQTISKVRNDSHKGELAAWKNSVEEKKVTEILRKPSVYKTFNSPVQPLSYRLPSKWISICLGSLCTRMQYGTSEKSDAKGLVPVLRMGNIQNGKIDWSDLKYSSNTKDTVVYGLHQDDVLFNRTNSPELVGKAVCFKSARPAIFAGYLLRLNHIRGLVNGVYMTYFLNSHEAKTYGSIVKTDGVNQSNINATKLGNYPFPYCSLEEQNQIVREIETRLSVCDQVEKTIEESLEKAKALRQSILKKAFEGTLLAEEEIAECKAAPDYEPASVLLERIRVEKEASKPIKKKK